MSFSGEQEPPRHVWLSLDEVLDLLAVLEDARDALTDSGHLTVVVALEAQVRQLSRRLDFDEPGGRRQCPMSHFVRPRSHDVWPSRPRISFD